MRLCGCEIREVESDFTRALETNPLVIRHVTGCGDNANALHDVAFACDEVELSGIAHRHEVVREVARGRSLVGVRGELVLSRLHHVPGLRERRTYLTVRGASGVAARVVEMQVRVDD